MDKALGWVGEIFQTLLKFLPWLVVVPATSKGVAFARGYKIKVWEPGVHWYWPLVTSYKVMMTVRQTQMIKSKVVMTRDMKTVLVGALVTYHIDDIVSALAKIADLPSDIMERSLEAILEVISERTLEEIQSSRPVLNRALTDKVATALNGYGVCVIQAQLTEFAPCRALSINGHVAVGQYSLWTGF